MKLTQLRDLMAIVERGSLRAAARHLGQPQPALTRSIHALERELGEPLFERTAKGMTLTAAGRLFHQRASSVLNELKRAQDELAQRRGDMRGTVVAGLSIMPHMGPLPHVLPRFKAEFPHIRLKIIEGLYPVMERGLRDGSIDFYVGACPYTTPAAGLLTEVLGHNLRSVVGRRGHPLSGAKSLAQLTRAEWAVTSINVNAEEDLQRLFARHRLPAPEVTLHAHSSMTIMTALANTDLLALLPVQWQSALIHPDALAAIAVKEVLAAPDVVLIRRAELPMTPAAERFCELMRRYVQ
ncbi:LysR family transcriptional regulator [Pigmentiphaga sp. NML080357]|uniref:LysR substrate-binding domain-containing protein n=1 Tax=Pigmentiphaga sp. NML080357 TaxID=2008675 RepID=UPI000B4084AB|nr:LysR substrate-binding domain-containing protein [Pigmentiphaga sp. NML080357]OVZ57170.1 LysR family transcriptional regulator [Pigmentiphaga sp. NML080357]